MFSDLKEIHIPLEILQSAQHSEIQILSCSHRKGFFSLFPRIYLYQCHTSIIDKHTSWRHCCTMYLFRLVCITQFKSSKKKNYSQQVHLFWNIKNCTKINYPHPDFTKRFTVWNRACSHACSNLANLQTALFWKSCTIVSTNNTSPKYIH